MHELVFILSSGNLSYRCFSNDPVGIFFLWLRPVISALTAAWYLVVIRNNVWTHAISHNIYPQWSRKIYKNSSYFLLPFFLFWVALTSMTKRTRVRRTDVFVQLFHVRNVCWATRSFANNIKREPEVCLRDPSLSDAPRPQILVTEHVVRGDLQGC